MNHMKTRLIIGLLSMITLLMFGRCTTVNAAEDATTLAIKVGIKAAGYNLVDADYTDAEGFDPSTDIGVEIYNALSLGYAEDDDYRAARDIYIIGGSKGSENHVSVIVYRFDSEQYAMEGLQSCVAQTNRLLSSSTTSADSSSIETEGEALAIMADQMFGNSRVDFTHGTFNGNPSYLAHGYSSYSSSEADQLQKAMFGDVHTYTFSWTDSAIMVTVATTTLNANKHAVPYIYDALKSIGTLGPQVSEDIIVDELVDPEMRITLSPTYFKELEDTVSIEVLLLNDLGLVAPDETVTLEHLEDGSVMTAMTNSVGKTTFLVKHTLEDQKNYTYKVNGLQITKTIEIPVRTAAIQFEINPKTEEPYIGVIAHKDMALNILIDFSEFKDGRLVLFDPDLGEVSGDALSLTGTVKLDQGLATLNYSPPDYLTNSILTIEDASLGWRGVDTLNFTYTDENGTDSDYTIDIDLYRPPVVLVHGFTGDASTWQVLDYRLTDQKYHTIREEYYYGDQTIEAQAWALDTHITDRLILFLAKGIKADKVDVIAHSMGGLISRYYVNNASYYNNNVRKLIMVGTPNHGCTWVDKQLGIFQSKLIKHHELAALQLAHDSSFMYQLNKGEATGAHLNPKVQYGLLYGFSAKPWFFGGDVVVSATSAWLNGIMNVSVNDVTHSGVFRKWGPPITEYAVPFTRIETWLQEDIYKPGLRNSTVELVSLKGKATIKAWSGNQQVETVVSNIDPSGKPIKLNPYDDITTSDAKAIIKFSVNGIAVGYVNIDKHTHIRIGNASIKHLDVKLLSGSARYITFDSSTMHFIVEIEKKNGEWQTVTGLGTDFVVTNNDVSDVILLDGAATLVYNNENDDLEQVNISKGEAVTIDILGKINDHQIGSNGQWWEDDFYKIPLMTTIKGAIVEMTHQMINKSKSMGYSLYAITVVFLMFLFIMLMGRRHKWLFGVLLITLSFTSIYMLYYVSSDIQLPFFDKINQVIAGIMTSYF